MRTVQLLMEEKILKRLDVEARRQSRDRSKLVREAVRRYLITLERERDDDAYARAYQAQPDHPKEAAEWVGIQAWPED